jgi:serine/threonine protein kinase
MVDLKKFTERERAVLAEFHGVPPARLRRHLARVSHLGPQLGHSGQTARVHASGQNAVKIFNADIPAERIRREAVLQREAARQGLAPRVVSWDSTSITMERMDETLYHRLKRDGFRMAEPLQRRFIEILRGLDELRIFHGDPNPLNFMLKDGRLYIGDFGMASRITAATAAEHRTWGVNMAYMPMGFLMRLADVVKGTPDYKVIEKHI